MKEKDFFRQTKTKRINGQQTCTTRKVKAISLGKRYMIPERKSDLHEKMKSVGKGINEGEPVW